MYDYKYGTNTVHTAVEGGALKYVNVVHCVYLHVERLTTYLLMCQISFDTRHMSK